MTQTKTDGTLDTEVVAFVNAGIASKNIGMMKGIAETVTDLSDEQLKALLFSGSLEVAIATIANLKDGSTVFAELAQTALSDELIEMGAILNVVDSDGEILDTFTIIKPSCDIDVVEDTDASTRFAKDNVARIIMAFNLDEITVDATTSNTLIVELEKAILNNQAAPLDVVTPFLVNSLDELRALAFVHTNTDNAEIVAVMTADDTNGINIDGFKLAMIRLLNTDEMIQGNPLITAYLMAEDQSVAVSFAMFKNYMTVLANGGSTVAGIDIDRLIAAYIK
jgi:hypothetical protein